MAKDKEGRHTRFRNGVINSKWRILLMLFVSFFPHFSSVRVALKVCCLWVEFQSVSVGVGLHICVHCNPCHVTVEMGENFSGSGTIFSPRHVDVSLCSEERSQFGGQQRTVVRGPGQNLRGAIYSTISIQYFYGFVFV